MRTESNPISDEKLALIKEKRRLRRQYSQNKDPAVKTRINQLQKQVKEALRVKTQASWEKFCYSISLESDPSESWRNSKTSSCLRVSVTIQHSATTTKSPRQTPIKRDSLPNQSKDTSALRANILIRNHFDEVSKFIEDNHRYFYPPEDPDDYSIDVRNDHDLVEDVDPQTLIKLVKFLKRGKAPGPDTIHN